MAPSPPAPLSAQPSCLTPWLSQHPAWHLSLQPQLQPNSPPALLSPSLCRGDSWWEGLARSQMVLFLPPGVPLVSGKGPYQRTQGSLGLSGLLSPWTPWSIAEGSQMPAGTCGRVVKGAQGSSGTRTLCPLLKTRGLARSSRLCPLAPSSGGWGFPTPVPRMHSGSPSKAAGRPSPHFSKGAQVRQILPPSCCVTSGKPACLSDPQCSGL